MSLLKSKRFNDWPLFYAIVAVNSLIVVGYMPTQDLSAPRGISEMIQLTVRACVPLLFLSFAASSIAAFSSGPVRRWLLRNRRYFGLGFAAGMAWQMVFILWLAIGHPEFYAEEVFTTVSDFIIYRLGPYLFLVAMVISSFHPVRRSMNPSAWRVLHWIGIYYLWYDVELTYWEEVTLYHDRQIIDYIYVTLGALAYFARVAVWIRSRLRGLASRSNTSTTHCAQ